MRRSLWSSSFVAQIVVAGALASTGVGQTVQPPAVPVALSAGATVSRVALEGETYIYHLPLDAGTYFDVRVSQEPMDLRLSLRGPGDRALHSIELTDTAPLPARLLCVAGESGDYTLDVYVVKHESRNATEPKTLTPYGPGLPAATYTLEVLALRSATADDRARSATFEELERAGEFVHQRSMTGLRQAIPLYRQAAAEWRVRGDDALEAATLETLASLTGYFTDFRNDSAAARERLTQLYAQMGESRLEILSWRLLGRELGNGGRVAQARDAVSRALDLARSRGDRVAIARSQREVELYEFDLGNYDRSHALAEETVEIAAAIQEPAVEALAMYDLSKLDELAGDLAAAVARKRRALELASQSRYVLPVVTVWLGFDYLGLGEFDKAEATFEARLAMSPTFVQRDEEALTKIGLGDVMRVRGDRAAARKRYEESALALANGVPKLRCIAEERVGRIDLEEQRFDEALAHFKTMLEIAVRGSYLPCEAEGRAGLADVAARRGDLETAEAEAGRVIELTESFREATVSLESRALGFGVLEPAYERAIDICMKRAERGDSRSTARALQFNEQRLGRGLLDRVIESRVARAARAPAALLAEQQDVRERWRSQLNELQVAMLRRPGTTETRALKDETELLAVQVRDLGARIDEVDPRQGRLARPRPLDVDGIQALLDDDTLLLEYALGAGRSYLWAVSAHDVRAFWLPPRAEIDAAARRIHESLARSPAAGGDTSSREAQASDLRALSRLLLAPAAGLLSDRRLAVVASGSLSLVPFGALPTPGDGSGAPMIARHEIVQLPSATILGAMRTLASGRVAPKKGIAVFADPIFDAHDPRVRAEAGAAGFGPAPAKARAGAAGVLPLVRLPFTRDEAAAIASLAPDRTAMFVGSEASRARALRTSLADFRFIHFATHSIVNEEVPSLSSIALSMVDEHGAARDGLVMLADIYEMTLNADVVVLSGCRTALGRNVPGEGPIGLARGFMYAGVPRLVASLWEVSDRGTAELMRRFYRGVLVDRLPPAAALRAAQRALAADPRWRSPYFWAPFVLEGDWR